MKVILYGKPNCGGCTATKAALIKQGTPFKYVDVTVDGYNGPSEYRSMPVVVAGSQHWSGFQLDLIKALVTPDA